MVAGFGVASVYAVGDAARPPGPLPPAGLPGAVHRARRRSRPSRSSWATGRRGSSPTHQPVKLAAIEGLDHTGARVPAAARRPRTSTARCAYAIEIPDGLSLLAATGTRRRWSASTPCRPPTGRRSTWCTWRSRSWSAIGFGLLGLGAGSRWSWWRRRDLPASAMVPARRRVLGRRGGRRDGGGVDHHRGRPPAVDRVAACMRTADAVNPAPGLWAGLVAVLAVYVGADRARRCTCCGRLAAPVPVAPAGGRRAERRCRAWRWPAGPRWVGLTLLRAVRRAPTSAAGSGTCWPAAPQRGAPQRAPDRGLHRAGVGGQPRLADLRPRAVLDGVPAGLRRRRLHAVHPAHPRRARHHRPRRGVRVPQGQSPSLAAAPVRRPRSRCRRCSRRSSSAPSPAASRPGASRPASPRVTSFTSWWNPTSVLGGPARRSAARPISPPSTSPATPAAAASADLAEAFRRRALVAAAVTGAVALVGILVLRADAPRLFAGLTGRALPVVVVSALAGIASLGSAGRAPVRLARVPPGSPSRPCCGGGRSRSTRCCCPPTSRSRAPRPSPSVLHATLGVVIVGMVLLVPSLLWLYSLFQRPAPR